MRALKPALLLAFLLTASSRAHAIKLRFNWKEGDAFRYKTMLAAASEFSAPDSPAPNRVQERGAIVHEERVLRVNADGTLEIESSNLSGSVRAEREGEAREKPAPKNRTKQRMTPTGKVISAKTEDEGGQPPAETPEGPPGPGASDLFDASLILVFPDKELQVGDRWTEEFEVRFEEEGAPPMKVRFTGELLDLVTIDLPHAKGLKCAKIKARFHIPMSDSTSEAEGTMGSGSFDAHVGGEFTTYFAYERGVVAFAEGWVGAQMKASFSFPGAPGVEAKEFEASAKMKMNVKTVWQR